LFVFDARIFGLLQERVFDLCQGRGALFNLPLEAGKVDLEIGHRRHRDPVGSLFIDVVEEGGELEKLALG